MKPSQLRFLCLLLTLVVAPAFAAKRVLTITAPETAPAGGSIHVAVTASTDATDGEHIGFFQPEYSTDGGKTWVPVYAENVGRSTTRGVDFPAGPAGSKAMIRVRIAFRGGKAGDVDFAGQPIVWGGSWGKWETPPAKVATVQIVAQP